MSESEERRYEEEEVVSQEGQEKNGWVSLTSWLLRWVVAAGALMLFKGPIGLRFGPIEIGQWYLANLLLITIIAGTWLVVALYIMGRREQPGSEGILLKALMVFHILFLVLTQLPVLAEI